MAVRFSCNVQILAHHSARMPGAPLERMTNRGEGKGSRTDGPMWNGGGGAPAYAIAMPTGHWVDGHCPSILSYPILDSP